MLTAEYIKKKAIEYGATVCRIGRVYDEPDIQKDPKMILPAAKCIIGFGFAVPRGLYAAMERGSQYYTYVTEGVKYIDEEFAEIFLFKIGNIIENAIFAEICKNKNFTFTHYNADAQHKDITCECINCISNSLKEKLKEAKQYYGNHSSFDTPNIFGLEIKTSKKFTEITANKTASTNVNVQKDPFSFYLMIIYYHEEIN